MLIRDLFISEVTRDIPPVVYFHEQDPAKLADEVNEYIITGGWREGHPNHRRVPNGIHEQYVSLLRGISSELDKSGGPELPNAWISGFYGSGKSSFAKLLGMALDGVTLPDGRALSEALLSRDFSDRADELREAWRVLRQKVDPLAVVFDIGTVAQDHNHIHTTCVHRLQRRLGYCATDPLVADFELKLERDGHWQTFEDSANETLGRPWREVKDNALAEEDFSLVMSVMFPQRYTDPMSWYTSRAGTHSRAESPDEAVTAIRDMLDFRSPGSTLFFIIDEVSQYILSNKDRVDRLRAFASALGAMLKGRAWLLALGQQKLDEEAGDAFLVWAKDRFPPKLRVHLAATNIRDVVHKRLLQKTPAADAHLRTLFEANRASLKLYAYDCESITPDEFVDVYPMLPGHIDLLLEITTALRTRSSARPQGDDQAIRGLLQLLGELFRDQKLADLPVGRLVTLDQIYEVQHSALDSDVQTSMARLLHQCAKEDTGDQGGATLSLRGDQGGATLWVRVAKAVALLELIQDTVPTAAKLVAQCLYDQLDRGNRVDEITEALEELRRRNLLGYTEKQGYKIQSSAGEEWERERREIPVPGERISEIAMDGLKILLGNVDKPLLSGRPFTWAGVFSDGRRFEDAVLVDPRDDSALRADFRFMTREEERAENAWVRLSAETMLNDRLVWVSGSTDQMDLVARELARSLAMVRKYKPRRESLGNARKMLLQQEENRSDDLRESIRDTVGKTWMSGTLYFRGRDLKPRDQGAAFTTALQAAGSRLLRDLFPHFVPIQVDPSELMQLVEPELSGPSPKFLGGDLGILDQDAGRYVPACGGVVPRRVGEHIENEGGVGGTFLLAYFGRPPFGYTPGVVKACVAGLLRAGQLRIQPDGGTEITAVRDAGVREVFEKDRGFRRATFYPAGSDDIGFQARARICRLFKEQLNLDLDREDHLIADAVGQHFPQQAQRLREVLTQLNQLPGSPEAPRELRVLDDVLENCIRGCRQTQPTVKLVKTKLDKLRDGLSLLAVYHSELVAAPNAVEKVRQAAAVRDHQAAQLAEAGALERQLEAACERIQIQLERLQPWREIVALEPDLEAVKEAYGAERQRLLEQQGARTEEVRSAVKGRLGFSTLTLDQSHSVMRPFGSVVVDTTAEAVAPSLKMLEGGFLLALTRAEQEANELLDGLLSAGDQPLISTLDLGLRHREIVTEADVEALVEEIRRRLLEQIRRDVRVRLI